MFKTVNEFLALTGPNAPTSAERALIEACRAGEPCILSETRPTSGTDANTVRAPLLRLLILGGTPDCGLRARGVTVLGAWITGRLDLADSDISRPLRLENCHFTEMIDLTETKAKALSFSGSKLVGLSAPNLTIFGSLEIKNVISISCLDLRGTKIDGKLDAERCEISGTNKIVSAAQEKEKVALDLEGCRIQHSIFLTNTRIEGLINLNGARIGGILNLNHSSLDAGEGRALTAYRASIAAGLWLKTEHKIKGIIHLTSTHVGDLRDDAASWPNAADSLRIDGFTYDRISGAAPVTLSARRDWLAVGSSINGDFRPQPYTQFARTLRTMGHPREARRVMIEANVQRAVRDRAVLRAQRALLRRLGLFARSPTDENLDAFLESDKTIPAPARDWAKSVWNRFNAIHRAPTDLPNAPPTLPDMTMALARQGFQNDMAWGALSCQVKRVGNKLWNGFLHRTVGFGYAPHYSIAVLAVLIFLAFLLALAAWTEGSFAPNSDVILTSPAWTEIAAQGCVVTTAPGCIQNPAATWSAKNAPGMDWDSFNAIAYAADLVVPLIDLGQTSAWAPSKDRGWFGWFMWWGRWLFIIAGWVVASLGLAAITGFVQKNAPE